MKTARAFLVLAALPLVVLALLATFGARDDVGVVMTGSGSHALLGAAWVVCWLGTMTLSPIAAGAALVSFVLLRTIASDTRSNDAPPSARRCSSSSAPAVRCAARAARPPGR